MTIDRQPVEVPESDATVFTYDGEKKTYTIAANDNYTVANAEQMNAGTYTVTVTLKDTKNFVWNDKTDTVKEFPFVIAPAKVTVTIKDKSAYVGSKTAPDLSNPEKDKDYTISGLIGEDPQGIPNNLMPYVSQVAVGKREKLTIFGKDYDTPDGTCRRDFIHVTDLAKGHVKAVEYAMKTTGTEVFNMGTGTPYSVLEIVKAFQDTNALKIPYEFGPRRPGDLAECWADAAKAERILGWKAEKNLTDMCRDTWNWQKNNPDGYR